MGLAQWMRVLDTVGGLVQMTSRFRRGTDLEPSMGPGPGAGGQLEARLAGVVVAALKEAFDRDRARLDLERSQMDAEHHRAEEALRAELRRQSADRALSQLRLVAVMALGTWMLTAALGVWLPGMRDGTPRMLLGAGWLVAIAALGCAFAGWQHVSAWSADVRGGPEAAHHSAAAAAPWLLLGALALSGASLLWAL